MTQQFLIDLTHSYVLNAHNVWRHSRNKRSSGDTINETVHCDD